MLSTHSHANLRFFGNLSQLWGSVNYRQVRYPSSPFMVLYNAYRIVRQGGEDDVRRARYFVQRPDGAECSRDLTWAEAERAIRRDMRERNWPADSLPSVDPNGNGNGQAERPKRRRASSRSTS
jgi:hypothetical protein